MMNLETINRKLRDKSPEEIVKWVITYSCKRMLSTSFGEYSAAMLHLLHKTDPNIDVIWCDTGFNTEETYEHAIRMILRFNLNIHAYNPLISKARIESTLGIPEVGTPEHEEFKEIVKLEPFRRALSEHLPEVWFTNIRAGQTAHRDEQDILSYSQEGILKVSPFYYWSDSEMDRYLGHFDLPKNHGHFDVTKALANRECGIHYQ
jgi:phosphoadenosine phosphosulfate reductase